MQVKSYRARSLQEALAQVRRELGPDAAVLETREVHRGWLGGWFGGTQFEVTASRDVVVPSRFASGGTSDAAAVRHPGVSSVDRSRPERLTAAPGGTASASSAADSPSQPAYGAPGEPLSGGYVPAADATSHRDRLRFAAMAQEPEGHDSVLRSDSGTKSAPSAPLPESLFVIYTRLMEAEVPEELAQELIQRVRSRCSAAELQDVHVVQDRLVKIVEERIAGSAPIQVIPGQRRLVALVGPTGVGKTTTIAKLAANFRLKEKRQVGLITVDTYRIAAVEQLRTYADIIDLPMEVVSTPREMREAVNRLAHLDLVLMDTAGRSPRDEIRIQELKSLLAEAAADEVHLVLSAVGSASGLRKTAEHFAAVGTTALLLTKLDEAPSSGTLLPLLRQSQLPISYLTDGQNVPDDIHAADRSRLTRYLLGIEPL